MLPGIGVLTAGPDLPAIQLARARAFATAVAEEINADVGGSVPGKQREAVEVSGLASLPQFALTWGLPSNDWKWSAPYCPALDAQEMGALSLRRTLALSLVNTPEAISRRSDAEERELWLMDLVKQSQVPCRPVSCRDSLVLCRCFHLLVWLTHSCGPCSHICAYEAPAILTL